MGDRVDLPPGRAQASVETTREGQVLKAGQYQLVKKIGEGGMGEVYLARHTVLNRRVAIKLMHYEHRKRARHRERFVREAKTLATLHSEHVVAVTDFGFTDDDLPFMVMELLEGHDLRELLNAEGSLAVNRAIRLVLGALEGVKAAHDNGLVHRDLKPANLFVVKRPGGAEYCKVLDFGVAKQQDATALTNEGALIGTVQYMAPEQVLGEGAVDERVDVFALGCILYECVSGRPAFNADKREGILYKITHEDAKPLGEVTTGVPAELQRAVARALQRDPSRRHQSVAEFAAELLQVPLTRHQTPPPPRDLKRGSEARTRAGQTSVDRSLDGFMPSVHSIPGVSQTPKRMLAVLGVTALCMAGLLGFAYGRAPQRDLSLRVARTAPVQAINAEGPATTREASPARGSVALAPTVQVMAAPPAQVPADTSSKTPPQMRSQIGVHSVQAPIAPKAAAPAAELSLDPNPYR